MTDKTLGEYKRTTPDPDETIGEALARLQAELTRLLDEADAEMRDEADGGVAAALIEKEAEARAAMTELAPAEVCVRGDWFKPSELPGVLGRVMDARDEAQREAKRYYLHAAESRPLTPDAITDEMVERAKVTLEALAGGSYYDSTIESVLAAALTSEPQRPAWLYAPAVRAWHRNDGRTEHDGTPGKPRIWSPDYGTTETWSTPSLREVPWTDLVDVEPLDVSAELAEGLDRVAEFMSTGMVRAREDGAA